MGRTKKAEIEAAEIEAAEQQKAKTIEETFQELEAIVEKMESGDSSLEESFACYEAGIKLVKECSIRIDKVEKQIMVLTEEGGANET